MPSIQVSVCLPLCVGQIGKWRQLHRRQYKMKTTTDTDSYSPAMIVIEACRPRAVVEQHRTLPRGSLLSKVVVSHKID